MHPFYLTPFSLSVLNVAIMLTLLAAFIWRIPDKSTATRYLLGFLLGVDLVFVGFFFIFSLLDPAAVRIAWWILHLVVFSIVALVQFAYHYPVAYFSREARRVGVALTTISAAVYLFYLYHTTWLEPVFDASGGLFFYLETHELGVLIGLMMIWALAVFLRQARRLSAEEGPERLRYERQAAAIRHIVLILISPIALIVAVVLAYLGIVNWELVGHVLGTGLMVVVLLFIIVYLNNAVEPSSLQIKMVGSTLGAILVVLGFATAITMGLHKQAFLDRHAAEIERSARDLAAARFEAMPPGVAYVVRDGEVVHRSGRFAASPDTPPRSWEDGWLFQAVEPLDASTWYLAHDIEVEGARFQVGYPYALYRAHLHAMAAPILWVMLGAVVFVVVAFPLFFRLSLFRPLRILLGGVDRMERGELDIQLPVGVRDELGVLTQSFNTMVGSVREGREKLRAAYDHQIDLTDAYSRFVPKEILTTLNKQSILELELGDNVRREMTVLFSDIRSFTTISEAMDPEQVFRFVNHYLEQVGPIVRRHGGYIDKYIGDAVMALFPGGPDDALAAAIDMHEQVRVSNAGGADEDGFVEIRIGVGIHLGELMLGTIGEHERMEGTVISDAVNLAARMEGLTKAYDAPILISRDTFEKLATPERFQVRRLDRVKVKGKTAWVDIMEVLDGDDEVRRAAKLAQRESFETGVTEFQQRRFPQALERFRALDEADRAVSVYIERCEQFISQGIPENWDGAVQL